MEEIIYKYLRLLNVPLSKRYFTNTIASHHDYPSFLSVSDTLTKFGIPHGVAHVEVEYLKAVNFPYVLHSKKGGGGLELIRDEKDLINKSHLFSDGKGIVLKVDPPRVIKDVKNNLYLSQERSLLQSAYFIAISSFIVVILGVTQNYSLINILLIISSILGLVVSYLLVAKDLGVNYDTIESLCNRGNKTDCDKVLSSKESTIFGQFTLSDAVIGYFSAQLISASVIITLAGNTEPLWFALAFAGLLSLPLVFYSLWLQAFIIKSWCMLCLMVSSLLLIQAVIYVWVYNIGVFEVSSGFHISTVIIWGVFVTCFFLTYMIRILLKESVKKDVSITVANRIKYDPNVFLFLLKNQKKVEDISFEHEYNLGMEGAPISLTFVASLGCKPCEEGFDKVFKLLDAFPNKLEVKIIFQFFRNSESDPTPPMDKMYLFTYWSNYIHGKKDYELNSRKILENWYKFKDIEKFKKKYHIKDMQEAYLNSCHIAAKHNKWIEMEKIFTTPQFFLNGYKFPKNYDIEELSHLLPIFYKDECLVKL